MEPAANVPIKDISETNEKVLRNSSLKLCQGWLGTRNIDNVKLEEMTGNKRKATLVDVCEKGVDENWLNRLDRAIQQGQVTSLSSSSHIVDARQKPNSLPLSSTPQQGLSLLAALPKKRKRYQRRNSFVIHRKRGVHVPALMHSNEKERNHHSISEFPSLFTQELDSIHSAAAEDDTVSCPSNDMDKNGDDSSVEDSQAKWGHASWPESDDRYLFTRFSSLSFGSFPTGRGTSSVDETISTDSEWGSNETLPSSTPRQDVNSGEDQVLRPSNDEILREK